MRSPLRGSGSIVFNATPRLAKPRLGLNSGRCFTAPDNCFRRNPRLAKLRPRLNSGRCYAARWKNVFTKPKARLCEPWVNVVINLFGAAERRPKYLETRICLTNLIALTSPILLEIDAVAAP